MDDTNNQWNPNPAQAPADPAVGSAPVADPNAGGWTPPVDPVAPAPMPEPAAPVAPEPAAPAWTPAPTPPVEPVAPAAEPTPAPAPMPEPAPVAGEAPVAEPSWNPGGQTGGDQGTGTGQAV